MSEVKVSVTARLRKFLEKETTVPIVVAVLMGVAFVAIAFTVYACRCWGNGGGECAAIRTSLPWTQLTALAATPAALLTWYWRTDHKKRDIGAARDRALTSRFSSAVQLLEKNAVGAIYALERLAKDSARDHWAVMETLAALIRAASDSEAPKTGTEHDRRVRIQAAVTAIGRREPPPGKPEGRIDLSGALVAKIDFRGLDFRGALFDKADISDALFKKTKLAGATFVNVNAEGVLLDEEHPEAIGEEQLGWLLRGGARMREEVEEEIQRSIDHRRAELKAKEKEKKGAP